MIACYWKWYIWNSYIAIPHEINNQFTFNLDKYTLNNSYKWGHLDIWMSDHREFNIPIKKLDKLIKDYEILENNLDEVIKIIPLPKIIWKDDWYYYPWFIDYTNDRIDREIFETKDFIKEDMLLLIKLIKGKAKEAKEKNVPLIFSWD